MVRKQRMVCRLGGSMDVLVWNVEIGLLSLVLVGLHSLRARVGLVPLYVAVGLVLGFMMIAGPLQAKIPALLGPDVGYGSLVHLALVLTSLALVYALEGTREARRLTVGILLVNMLMLGLKLLLAWHLGQQGDLTVYGREAWMHSAHYGYLVSTVALAVDALVILVVYQATYNLAPRLGLVFALTVALVAAMAADGLVYGSLFGALNLQDFGAALLSKATAGLSASIPVGLYIAWRYWRWPEHFAEGVIHRGAFDIMDLREQLRQVQSQLQESQAEVDHVRHVFGRYVAPDVVNEILADVSKLELGGEVRDVTILFTDIRGYSTLSEAMSPTQVIGLLNEFFGVMSRVLEEHGGTIIEFEGDAILAVFGAPSDQPDHADRAVRTGLAMLDAVQGLNAHWEASGTARFWQDVGLPDFKIRIGIHSGTVVAGNVGSETRAKYAVIGDTVNTAARVETLNKTLRTVLLLTRQTHDRLQALEAGTVELGSHEVRGRGEPVEVFTVQGLEPKVQST